MRTRPFIHGTLIAAASLVVGMVIAARLDLTPSSLAGTFSTPVVNTAPLSGAIDATTFRTIAQAASPAVVSISVQVKAQAQPWGDLFGLQMPGRRGGRGGQQPPQDEYSAGAGSGFIIDKAGLILTNNHVIEDAVKIEVSFADSRTGDSLYAAEIVGRDELTDTALIRLKQVPDHALTEIKFGDSGQMAPGDWVMAIGNPFRLSNSVSVGIVSAVGRPYRASVSATGASRWEEMIQTDAAINRGNSGGPLLNIRGEVVGINTMIYSDNSGGNIGIGFAVPINRVVTLLPQLKEGKITRGRIGVELSGTRLTKEDAEDRGLPSAAGAVISNVDDQGPAKAAGIKMDDVVVEFNGKPVKDNDSLITMVTGTAPGTTVPIKVVRDKKALTLSVKVDELNLAQERGAQETAGSRSARGSGDVSKETGFGMRIQELTPSDARDLRVPGKAGAVVTWIDPLGTAAQSGVAEGDVILRINGEAMTNLDQVSKALDSVGSGRTARMVVWSQGREQLLLVRKR